VRSKEQGLTVPSHTFEFRTDRRNTRKGLCEKRAKEQGIATASLPISQHAHLAGTHVLTVNQVVSMLSLWLVSHTIKEGWRGGGHWRCERADVMLI